jgi:hypothetical protein
MILIDNPRSYVGRPGIMRGRPFCSSHMISDVPGRLGRVEMLEFAVQLGMKPSWLQHGGSAHEHFDVMNSAYYRAVAAGAKQVSHTELVLTISAKAAWLCLARKIKTVLRPVLDGVAFVDIAHRLDGTSGPVLADIWAVLETWNQETDPDGAGLRRALEAAKGVPVK